MYILIKASLERCFGVTALKFGRGERTEAIVIVFFLIDLKLMLVQFLEDLPLGGERLI